MSWPRPWRDDVEERRKAEQVERNTREAARIADAWTPCRMPMAEDENGFVEVQNASIKGPSWVRNLVETDELFDGEPLPWLTGGFRSDS